MNVSLNLATRPYIELRPVYARLRIASAVPLLLALPLLLLLHAEQTILPCCGSSKRGLACLPARVQTPAC